MAPWREPYELRGSSTVLREARGAIPRAYSPPRRKAGAHQRYPQAIRRSKAPSGSDRTERRSARPPTDECGHFRLVRARIIRRGDGCDLFQDTIGLSECAHAGITIGEALFDHLARKAEKDVEQLGLTAVQSAGEDNGPVRARCNGSKRRALCSVALQLVHLIGDAVIEEALHVQANYVIPIGPKR